MRIADLNTQVLTLNSQLLHHDMSQNQIDIHAHNHYHKVWMENKLQHQLQFQDFEAYLQV